MPSVSQVLLDVVLDSGMIGAQLRIAILPGGAGTATPPLLVDLRGVPGRDETLEPVQLLEGAEYRYEFLSSPSSEPLYTDTPEVFTPDDETGRTGRLRSGLYTGAMHIKVFQGQIELGMASCEVRSRKLDYLTDYRRMLTDIAEAATEAVMERFATSTESFRPAATGDPRTLYQRFAFLQSLLSNDVFQAAVARIVARPYEAWKTIDEDQSPGQGMRGGSQLSRQLSSPGRRLLWPDSPIGIDIPARIPKRQVEVTLDNTPNRFVKFALDHWREVVEQLRDTMLQLPRSGSVDRGLRESQVLLERLDAVLGEELFREVGDLQVFPSGNQALQKREGYRDVFRAYVQFEVAAELCWEGGEDVYEAGQRDVATLYEYWAYLQLARILSDLCQVPLNFGDLLSVQSSGLTLALRKGRRRVLFGSARRLGRQLKIEMWYNKSFAASRAPSDGSWTVGMRPDFSIKISPDPGQLEHCEPVWVHCDAKYRVERIEDLLGVEVPTSAAAGEEEEAGLGVDATQAKRDDLLKMHAYRDAIHRSAGAYVLYPGDQTRTHRAYTEILPGLGAFKLRPEASGDVAGAAEIRAFLNSVLTHTAHQASRHERGRFWRDRVYHQNEVIEFSPTMSFLRRPPADTKVLVGFVKNSAHLAWIHESSLYNLRADERRGSISRELLDFELLLLWGVGLGNNVELWRVGATVDTFSAEDLRALDYPEPRGKRYYCLQLTEPIPSSNYSGHDRQWVERVLAKRAPRALSGAPALLTWSDLQAALP
jgi:predicted component of viral defense system (DUF524 family)